MERGFLAETRRLRELVHEIAALQARIDALDRPALREPYARLLLTEIENFGHRVAGFKEPLASEFRAAARRWRETAARQLAAAQSVLEREPVPQVFRAGDPVDRSREAFVPRDSVVGELERQVMLAGGCPGLVLYGRRRSGKSTVLRNLLGMIPPAVRPAVISMQNPRAFGSLPGLLGLLAEEIRRAVPEVDGGTPPADLPSFFSLLSACQAALEGADRRLLLALDEYEGLDDRIGKGVFSEDLLATVRESIQSHRRLIWVFAGSHEIGELRHAAWTSYLVSVRTVEVPMFTPAETRLLLSDPLRHSPLWSTDDPLRPRLGPEFWGDDEDGAGIDRLHAEAGGWPHLVQLLAESAVDFANDAGHLGLDAAALDEAFDRAVVRGQNVLSELMEGESTPEEWAYLSAFRRSPRQAPPGDERVARSLRRRLLIAEEDGEWRLRVPLMERWLRQRG